MTVWVWHNSFGVTWQAECDMAGLSVSWQPLSDMAGLVWHGRLGVTWQPQSDMTSLSLTWQALVRCDEHVWAMNTLDVKLHAGCNKEKVKVWALRFPDEKRECETTVYICFYISSFFFHLRWLLSYTMIRILRLAAIFMFIWQVSSLYFLCLISQQLNTILSVAKYRL